VMLEKQGYAHGTLDARLAAVFAVMDEIPGKEAEIRRLAEALARLRRPAGVLRMIVSGVLARVGVIARGD